VRASALKERTQRVVVFAAGHTSLEVGAHPADLRLGVLSLKLELDVLVEPLEALLAGDLRPRGTEDGPHQLAFSFHRRSRPLLFPRPRLAGREAALAELLAQLAAGVVHRLVEGAARRAQPVRQDVDRHVVERERDEDLALVRRQRVLDAVAKGTQELAGLRLLRRRVART
jgi:hypothetical protein